MAIETTMGQAPPDGGSNLSEEQLAALETLIGTGVTMGALLWELSDRVQMVGDAFYYSGRNDGPHTASKYTALAENMRGTAARAERLGL